MATGNFLKDFLDQTPESSEFFRANYLDKSARRETVHAASKKLLSDSIYAELAEQNEDISEATDRSLAKLKVGNTAVVMTGQQLGLLGGPLLTLYKALSAIRIARELEQESGVACVPVFWIQSEDHDYEEIEKASFQLHDGKRSSVFLHVPEELLGGPVGDLKIPESAEQLSSFIRTLDVEAKDLQEFFAESYKPGESLGVAYRELMQKILGSFGMLFFDCNTRAVKEQYREFISSSFLRCHAINKLLKERGEFLNSRGYKEQVFVRDRSPLFFLSYKGKRSRLEEAGDGTWIGDGFTLSKEELFSIIDTEPERFTTSALIRPVFQDTIFPTAAFITGPSEFNYWAQLKPLYEFFHCYQPLVVPRARLVLLPQYVRNTLSQYSLTADGLDRPVIDIALDSLKESPSAPQGIFDPLEARIKESFHAIEPQIAGVDPGLGRALTQTLESNLRNLSKFRGKYERALVSQQKDLVADITRAKEFCFPDDMPQERVISFASVLLQYGADLPERILQAIDPFQGYQRMEFDLK